NSWVGEEADVTVSEYRPAGTAQQEGQVLAVVVQDSAELVEHGRLEFLAGAPVAGSVPQHD
ncbi:MAG: hypothetical protein ABIL25_10710, partial [candidate division WOR-3 bacterium]